MNNIKLNLIKKDAVTLIYICIAQLFFHSVNNGLIDLMKFVFLLGSIVVAVLFLYNMHAKRKKKKETLHIIVYLLVYNLVLGISSLIFGGLITAILGILILGLTIGIDD